MTPNKHFNTYKEGLYLEFLQAYCMEHGERRVMELASDYVRPIEQADAKELPDSKEDV